MRAKAGEDPLLVFVTPNETTDGRYDPEPQHDDGAVILIRAFDARLDQAEQARVLERLWDLTSSEARLACLLSGGKSASCPVSEIDTPEASLRQYLKVVFKKPV